MTFLAYRDHITQNVFILCLGKPTLFSTWKKKKIWQYLFASLLWHFEYNCSPFLSLLSLPLSLFPLLNFFSFLLSHPSRPPPIFPHLPSLSLSLFSSKRRIAEPLLSWRWWYNRKRLTSSSKLIESFLETQEWFASVKLTLPWSFEKTVTIPTAPF